MKNLLLFGLIVCVSTALGCARKPSDGYQFGTYSAAEKHYSQGKYEKAIEDYNAYLAENPQGHSVVIAKYYIAKSYAALGQLDQARSGYEGIVKNYPDLVWAGLAEDQLDHLAV